jgi:ferredoxin
LVAGRGFFRFTFSYEMGHVVKALNLPRDGRRLVKRLKKAPPEEADRIKRSVARLLGAEVFYVCENRFEPVKFSGGLNTRGFCFLMTKFQINPPAGGVFAYTQHESSIQLIEAACGYRVVRLSQDRNRDPVEEILSQLPPAAAEQGAVLYAVLPPDKAAVLKDKAPWLRVVLLQLDGSVVERITGRPYDPKFEYSLDVVRQALRLTEIKKGNIRYMTFDDLKKQLEDKTVGVFNDVLREALQRLIRANFVKTCGGVGECVEINPLGARSGYRISFPGAAGRLSVEQMVEAIKHNARIYYLEIDAEETSLCVSPTSS